MGLVLTLTAGLVVWIVLWALGSKGFDSFMLATTIIAAALATGDTVSHAMRSSVLTALGSTDEMVSMLMNLKEVQEALGAHRKRES